MKVVALLPMKANSERVIGKNFRNFAGKPLFRWMLDKLIEMPEIDQIIINTDARDILNEHGLNESAKVLIRDRAPEICGDFVSMNKVINDDINNIESDIFLMTHTTNPMLTKDSIVKAIHKFKESLIKGLADSLFTVDRTHDRFYDSNALPLNHDPNKLLRSQDLEPWYKENSNLYLFTKKSFIKTGSRIGSQPTMFETSPYESLDIDTPFDWDLAETMVKNHLNK
tara:strand:- start:18223 stop:18900 length:678 start_codon:yes stop_codon:yes gene_type:complete